MTKRKQYSIHVEINDSVDINVADVLEELTDETLIDEMTRRKIEQQTAASQASVDEALPDILEMLRRGEVAEAELTLERLIFPKFKTLELCESEFKKVRNVTPDHQQ